MGPTKKEPAGAEGALPKEAAERVRALARLLEETGLTEIEIEQAGVRVRVARHPAPVHGAATPAPMSAASVVSAPAAAETPSDALANHPGLVRSPMVGVAYISSDPNAPPFVKVGDQVAAGQTLLLIEAMKVFNPIKAPRAGKVVRIFVANGAPVEYGEPLALIE